ncbi:MAG: DUF4124 domain-containing protein [Halothiobacillaceae bacterium]
MRHAFTLPLLLAVLAAPCQAAIYKWVDERGVTHYTEHPPASGKGQEIQPRVPPPATPAAPPAAKAPRTTEQTSPHEVMAIPAEKMAEQCRNARQRLQQLEASPRLLIKGPDGEMQRVPEEERQRMMDEERKRIQLYCE